MRRHEPAVLFVLLLLGQCASACYFDEKEVGFSRGRGIYSFDPETVLAALARGQTDIFTPQTATPRRALEGDLPPVPWTQADFYRLLLAFHSAMWPEPIQNWNLDDLSFALDCADTPLGLQYFSVQLYRTAPAGAEGYDDGYDSRFERWISINPRDGTIQWWESRISPNMRSRPGLDLDRVLVTAEQALQIAEQHGGEATRLAAGSSCGIRIAVVGGLWDGDWQVEYTVDGPDMIFRVDEQTGECRIVPEGK